MLGWAPACLSGKGEMTEFQRRRAAAWLARFDEWLDLLGFDGCDLTTAAAMMESGQSPCAAATMVAWGA